MSKKSIPWPPPGSKEAVERGCTCPIGDNNHGIGTKDGNYWVARDCPLHAVATKGK